MEILILLSPLLLGYIIDLLLGDPDWLPHPIVFFGKTIAKGEKALNKGNQRMAKGALLVLFTTAITFSSLYLLEQYLIKITPFAYVSITTLFIFWGIANKTLIKEGQMVFKVLHTRGLQAGRKQLSRIVGRDTSELTPQQIRTAALETMAENLSDGVVAPLFWFTLLGIPGMMTYKLINTFDSMIGYKNDRYLKFGRFAAKLDDLVNFIPARLTALLMAMIMISPRSLKFILKYGHQHASPNAGYPESALAGILNCRFGGPNIYHGQMVNKPLIGEREINFDITSIRKTVTINHLVTLLMFALLSAKLIIINL